MKKLLALSRRMLLKKSTLGAAGVLGTVGGTALGSTWLNRPLLPTKAVESESPVGMWNVKATRQAELSLSQQSEAAFINALITFYSDGHLDFDSDVDEQPPFKGPPARGRWSSSSPGQFSFVTRSHMLSLAGKAVGAIETQGTGRLDAAGNSAQGEGTVKYLQSGNLPPVTLSYTLQGTRVSRAVS